MQPPSSNTTFLNTRSITRKPDYIPCGDTEAFIVPLLRDWITKSISQYAITGCRVLDVGCGEQPFRDQLVAAGMRYESLDIVQNQAGSVDFVTAIDSPFPECVTPAAYHLVICTEVVEHVLNWDVAFSNLASVLAPKGVLILTCPHIYPLHEEPHDFWRPTLYAVCAFATRHGLSITVNQKGGSGWDILGTILMNARTTPASTNIVDRILSRLFNGCLSVLRVLFKMNWIKRRCDINTYFYMSNLFVLTKQ